MKSLHERFDDILVDPSSRTETDPEGDWSSVRFFLLITLTTFVGLSIEDAEFRDAGAFVTVILALIGAVVAPKILDLRMAIGQAAAAIGRKFTRKEAVTVTTETAGAPLEEPAEVVEEVVDVDPPPMGERDG